MSTATTTTSDEDYLKQFGVAELIDEVLGKMLAEKPSNPSAFIKAFLAKKENPFGAPPTARASASGEPNSGPRLDRRPTLVEQREQTLARRCLLIGCGAVGMACAYSIMIQGVFDELIMNDMNTDKTEGEAMDLQHGIPFTKGMKIKAGSIADGAGADIVIITAGVAQKPGETRIALVQRNVAIFQKMIPEVAKACPDAILLIVSNPVDILTYLAWKISGFPAERVIGSGTVLDSARFRHYIAKKFHLAPQSIHAYIIGEHGDSEVPAWSKMNVAGQNMYDPKDPEFGEIYAKTKKAAYEIIQKKGSTSYAIGMAVTHIVQAILSNTNRVMTISRYISKFNCSLSLPTIVNASGALEPFDVDWSSEEKVKLEASATALRAVLTEAGF